MYAADKAAEDPDGAALIFEPSGRTVTWAEYERTANQVAQLLRASGLRKHDHLALFMDNIPEVLLTEAGAERTGVYYTPVNSYLSAEEVAYIVNDSNSRVVFTSAAKRDIAAQLPRCARTSSAGSWWQNRVWPPHPSSRGPTRWAPKRARTWTANSSGRR